MYHHTV